MFRYFCCWTLEIILIECFLQDVWCNKKCCPKLFTFAYQMINSHVTFASVK